MTTALSPILLISAANAFVGLGEARNSADPMARGALAEAFLRQVEVGDDGLPPESWNAAFVHHVGLWSHFDARSQTSCWPLPPVRDAAQLAECAEEGGVLFEEPSAGDLFLLWAPAKRAFVRTGILVSAARATHGDGDVPLWECVTIEGDTDTHMSHRGGRILRHFRTLSSERGDRFVRWRELDRREAVANIVDLVTRHPFRRAA